MPTYEYECRQCGLHFERFQNISDQPPSGHVSGAAVLFDVLSVRAAASFLKAKAFMQRTMPAVLPV